MKDSFRKRSEITAKQVNDWLFFGAEAPDIALLNGAKPIRDTVKMYHCPNCKAWTDSKYECDKCQMAAEYEQSN